MADPDKNLVDIGVAFAALGGQPRQEFTIQMEEFAVVKKRLLQAQREKEEELKSQG